MSESSEIGLGGLAALGTIGSVCAILLRSTHQNLKTLDIMRRDAAAASERLRQELRHNDNTIFKLQGMCADYRYTIAKLEDGVIGYQDIIVKPLKSAPRPAAVLPSIITLPSLKPLMRATR